MADQHHSWLPGLAPASIAVLVQQARPRSFRPGAVVFHQGDLGTSMFLIQSGQVKITRPGANGAELVLGLLGAGECFGELSLIDGAPRSATIVATQPTETLVIHRADFLQALDPHPQLALDFLRVLARRVRDTNETVGDTLFLDVPGRLAKRLLALSEEYGVPGPEGIVLSRRLTQTELAVMVGATRKSVNQALQAWRAQGVLDRVQGRIRLRGLAELLARALRE